MISLHLQPVRYSMPISIVVLMFIMGCGAVGPPIPPENVGIEAKIRKQQRAKTQALVGPSEDSATFGEEDIVELPALYPIGTR